MSDNANVDACLGQMAGSGVMLIVSLAWKHFAIKRVEKKIARNNEEHAKQQMTAQRSFEQSQDAYQQASRAPYQDAYGENAYSSYSDQSAYTSGNTYSKQTEYKPQNVYAQTRHVHDRQSDTFGKMCAYCGEPLNYNETTCGYCGMPQTDASASESYGQFEI